MITPHDVAAPPAPEPPFAHADPIAAWLDVLIRLLRIPSREREEIRDELESHLRERVRDLMLAGHAEDHATTRAIAELGEAAQLAERFRAARNRPFLRRHAMNLSILSVAGAAIIMSAVALTTGTPSGAGSLVEGRPHVQHSESGEGGILSLKFQVTTSDPLKDATAEARFAGVTLAAALASLGEASGLPTIIRLDAFAAAGLEHDAPVNLVIEKQLPFPAIVRLLSEAVDAPGGARIEYRVADGILEIAPRDYFDRRETELIAYSVPLGADASEVICLCTTFVEYENWRDNGGELAMAASIGDRLFISAPPRMHGKIAWILRHLDQTAAHVLPAPLPEITSADPRPNAAR